MLARKTLVVLAAATLPLALPVALASPASAKIVHFTLQEMNGSGARATATVTSNSDGSLSVTLTGTGFTPDSPHAQHIHGSIESRKFFCPPRSADQNGDGQVATEEGLPQYGGIMLALTTEGDVSADSGLAVDRMPVADKSGFLGYSRRIPAAQVPAGLVENLENLHIVQHGLDANGNDKYDVQGLGESVFAKSLGIAGVPEEATNPATCGEVTPVGAVETGSGSTEATESAWLLALGGFGLAGAAAAVVMRRRLADPAHRS